MKKLNHVNLGSVLIDDACEYLNHKNPDPTSIFVRKDGEILEVTKALVSDISNKALDRHSRMVFN